MYPSCSEIGVVAKPSEERVKRPHRGAREGDAPSSEPIASVQQATAYATLNGSGLSPTDFSGMHMPRSWFHIWITGAVCDSPLVTLNARPPTALPFVTNPSFC